MNDPIEFRRQESIRSPSGLGETDVHLWAAELDVRWLDQTVILSEQENRRATRFRFERDRHRFLASHVFLRRVLANYIDSHAASLDIVTSASGKPSLSSPRNLHFNLSHSGEMAACAIAREPLGVDVEAVRPIADRDAMALQWLAPHEAAVLSTLPSSEQDRTFLKMWTRKEALLKAEGIGLAGISDDTLLAKWAVRDFELDGRIVGAVATDPAIQEVTAFFLQS